MIPLPASLFVAALLFVIGLVGVCIRRNLIMVFLCLELMLNAANLNLVAFSSYLGNLEGQILVLFTITIAAAEAVVGLALVVVLYRNRGLIQIDKLSLMKR